MKVGNLFLSSRVFHYKTCPFAVAGRSLLDNKFRNETLHIMKWQVKLKQLCPQI